MCVCECVCQREGYWFLCGQLLPFLGCLYFSPSIRYLRPEISPTFSSYSSVFWESTLGWLYCSSTLSCLLSWLPIWWREPLPASRMTKDRLAALKAVSQSDFSYSLRAGFVSCVLAEYSGVDAQISECSSNFFWCSYRPKVKMMIPDLMMLLSTSSNMMDIWRNSSMRLHSFPTFCMPHPLHCETMTASFEYCD